MTHCVKRANYLQFSKCENADCFHCGIRPVKAIGFMSLLKLLGGYIPSPIKSKIRKNHYMTLEETVIESRMSSLKFDNIPRDRGDKSHQCENGCNYIISSCADAERHNAFMGHEGKRKKTN